MDDVKRIDTPYNNAVALLNRTNEILNEEGVKDSTGTEIAQLEMNPANPAWLFAIACGALHTSWQRQLSKAYAALDPQSCEDDQVLVLAALAGIKRGDGTPSHITVRIANTGGEDVTVPVGFSFTESVTNGSWAINKSLALKKGGEVGSSALATLYSDKDGMFEVPEGTTFSPAGELPVLCESVSNSSGGTEIEALSSLRNRITQGVESLDQRLRAISAISGLSGIEGCTIWFNNGLDSMNVGSKVIPGRTAYISVKGVDINGKLADTYFTYMNVPATIGEQESLCMIGQQEMSVRFDYAKERTVSVFVVISRADMESGADKAIQSKIMEHSGTLKCGQNLTAQMVSEWVQNLGYGTIIGCNVNTHDGLITDIEPDEYCVFDADSISVTAWSDGTVSTKPPVEPVEPTEPLEPVEPDTDGEEGDE